MGYDERQQPNSSGALVAVIGVGLVLAILAIIVVAGVGLFWVRASAQREAALAAEQRAIAEAYRAGVEAQREVEEAQVKATPDPRTNFVLKLDHEGNISVDNETIGLAELRTRLVNATDNSSDEFMLRIVATPDCPKQHIESVVAVVDEVGGVTWHVVLPENADAPFGELNNVAN